MTNKNDEWVKRVADAAEHASEVYEEVVRIEHRIDDADEQGANETVDLEEQIEQNVEAVAHRIEDVLDAEGEDAESGGDAEDAESGGDAEPSAADGQGEAGAASAAGAASTASAPNQPSESEKSSEHAAAKVGGTGSGAPTTVLHNARLIDGTGSDPVADAVIVIEANKIVYAGPAAGAPQVDDSATRVDVGGNTVTPGFFDCHVHLALPGTKGSPVQMAMLTESFRTFQLIGRSKPASRPCATSWASTPACATSWASTPACATRSRSA
ncbi:MAG: hypothetical protein ACK5LO_09395 [Leucobacter sp.]